MNLLIDYLKAVSSFYHDDWFWTFPFNTLLISMTAFILLSIPWTLLAWINPKSLRKYRIQNKPIAVKKTFWPSIKKMIHNNIMMALVLILCWPLLKTSHVHIGETPPWAIIVAQLLLFILLDDFLYYWMHRAMHKSKWLLKHIHSVHHQIRNTCAINAQYMHWLEFVATASLMLIGPILVGAHLYVIWIWVVIRQFEAVDGHSGYDLPWNLVHYLPLYEGPPYHDFHHAKFKGNYSGCLSYLDRYMGNTYIKDYLDYIDKKKSRKSVSIHHDAGKGL